MTTFAEQILWQSVVAPAAISGFIALALRWRNSRHLILFGYATAFLVALAVGYHLVFGVPSLVAMGARQKIMALTVIGLAICLAAGLVEVITPRLLQGLAIVGPLWIGWPALLQGNTATFLLVLPIALGLWLCSRTAGKTGPTPCAAEDSVWLLALLAAGLAAIALFARTLSYAQLALMLASILASASLAGPRPRSLVLHLAGSTMLIGLMSALLLYSEASHLAMLILTASLASPWLANRLALLRKARPPIWSPHLIAAVLITAAAFIAWIDAGSVSVYEGAKNHGVPSRGGGSAAMFGVIIGI